MVIAQNYYRHFKPHFTNIVDIIVGWHLEQKSKVKLHCSIVLQSFHQCWQADSRFTLDLLGQLLEDIEGCFETLNEDVGEGVKKKMNDFGSFVGKKELQFHREVQFCLIGILLFKAFSTQSSNAFQHHRTHFLTSSRSRF